MSPEIKAKPKSRIAAALRSFRVNIQGMAAVEFGYLVPLLMVMVIGAFEISRMIAIDRKVGLVTSLVADMIAQERTMNQGQLDAIYEIAQHIMAPYDVVEGDLKISVTPVMRCSTADIDLVYASDANRQGYRGGANEYTYNSPYTGLTEGILQPGASVIVVETKYTFSPAFAGLTEYVTPTFGNVGDLPWEDRAVLAPRNNCVDFDGNNCAAPTNCP